MPLTNVPFLEPRSSSVARPAATFRIGVAAGDALGVDPDERVGAATQDVLAVRERDLAVAPEQAEDLVARALRLSVARERHGLAAERVAVAVDRADELGRARAVADRLADLGDQRREVDVRDDRVGPQPRCSSAFGIARGRASSSDLQQLEGLGRDRDRAAVARQRPAVGVEQELPNRKVMAPNENTIAPREVPRSGTGTTRKPGRSRFRPAMGSSRETRGDSDSAPRSVHDDVVLDAHAEAAGQVDAGLGGERHSGLQHRPVVADHVGRLVHVDAEPVAEPVREVLAVARLLDHAARGGVDLEAGHARARPCRSPRRLRVEDDRPDLPVLVGRACRSRSSA